MNHKFLFCLLCLLQAVHFAAYGGDPAANPPQVRDPFWPIGFVPESGKPAQGPEVDEPEHEIAPVLSEEELRTLARLEAERIRQGLKRRGTAVMHGRISAYLESQGRWVTIGDSFNVDVEGREYRLIITNLTTDNIELEPHRVPRITPNPGNEP